MPGESVAHGTQIVAATRGAGKPSRGDGEQRDEEKRRRGDAETGGREVVEFSQATLEASLFDVPEDYREVKDFASAFSAGDATIPADTKKQENSVPEGT